MQSYANILIAEDNDVSRNLMASILRAQGYQVHEAIDGDSAIRVINRRDVDMALVDINMAPKGGFEFIRYLVVQGIQLPVVVITGDDSSDVLSYAQSLGVKRLIQKPVEPKLLLKVVDRILRQQGINPAPLSVEEYSASLSAEDLMRRVVDLAEKNVREGNGGPFGAVLTDEKGQILAEAASGTSGRVDPTAHAEVMAIRKAAEKLGRDDLSGCVLYCSSEPTMMGRALIISVGIKQVYYGLSHEEIRTINAREDKVRAEFAGHTPAKTNFEQLGQDLVEEMFSRLQN